MFVFRGNSQALSLHRLEFEQPQRNGPEIGDANAIISPVGQPGLIRLGFE